MNTVIFDLDGTILDSIGDLANAVNYIQKKYDFPVSTLEDVKGAVGNGFRNLFKGILPAGTSDEFIDGHLDELVSYYKDHSDILTKPYDGVIDVLKALKAKGYKLALASNKKQEPVTKLVEIYCPGIFDIAMGERDNMNRKPHPDMINFILKELGETRENAIYIGDSEVDIKTANESHLPYILVGWGFRGREALEKLGATSIVDTADELLDAIVNQKY